MKRILKNNYYEIVTLIIAFLLFVLVSCYIYKEPEVNIIDATIRDAMYSFRGPKYGFWFIVFRTLTELGFVYFIVLLAALIGFGTRFDRRFWYLCGATIITYLANELIKVIYLRPRPIEELRWMSEASTSFPSGHSMVSLVFYGVIIYFIYSSDYLKPKTKKLVISLIILAIVLIGLSRIVLGVHYFTDVIGGYLCGLVFLMIFVMIYKKIMKKAPVIRDTNVKLAD